MSKVVLVVNDGVFHDTAKLFMPRLSVQQDAQLSQEAGLSNKAKRGESRKARVPFGQ